MAVSRRTVGSVLCVLALAGVGAGLLTGVANADPGNGNGVGTPNGNPPSNFGQCGGNAGGSTHEVGPGTFFVSPTSGLITAAHSGATTAYQNSGGQGGAPIGLGCDVDTPK